MADGGCIVCTRRRNLRETSTPSCLKDLAVDHVCRTVTTPSARVGIAAGVGALLHA